MSATDDPVLIVGPAWIGDMVMAQSLFKALRDEEPERRIDVLAPPWTLPLLAHMPEVAGALSLPLGHGELKLAARRRLGRELRRRGYAWAIVLPNSFKSALVPFWAAIPRRTGYLGEARFGLLNDWRRLDRAALPRTVDRFVALGLPRDSSAPGQTPAPALVVDRSVVAASLAALGLERPTRPLLALCPGAAYGPAKRWPAAHFAALARDHVALGGEAWLMGSAADRAVAAEVQRQAGGPCRDLTGGTDLGQSVALMSLADAVVSNDSGLMHVAAALDRRMVALYGSSSPAMTPPLSERATVLSLELPCSPCYQRRCPLGHLDCLRGIAPEAVRQALEAP